MAFKTYDELKRYLDTQTDRSLAPLLGVAKKSLDAKGLAALQKAQLAEAKAALETAERERSRAAQWHEGEIKRAAQRVQALEQALDGPKKPSEPQPVKRARKRPA